MNLIFILLCICLSVRGDQESESDTRYILYDVNPGEGFNLRRDVFSRIAVFVKKLNTLKKGKFILVLPPWGGLYHWQTPELGTQTRIPWKNFFQVEGINRYVPVMELTDYIELNGAKVDTVFYLQGYAEGWEDGKFEEKWNYRDCIEEPRYRRVLDASGSSYRGRFWDYPEFISKRFRCVSIQGSTRIAKDLILDSGFKSIMLDRAENLLHDWFGDEEYWMIRRAVRFSDALTDIANRFRAEFLDSNDIDDDTVMSDRWEDFRPERKSERGGPFLCAHLRRKDFVRSRADKIPSLNGAADQLIRKLEKYRLKKVFIATDAPESEFRELQSHFQEPYMIFKFVPETETLRTYKDGGVAIIDQSICSHARYFLGSYESTFTFRIQEEREIMGFNVENSFDVLCPDGEFDCKKGSIWKIQYPKHDKKSANLHQEL